MNGPISISDLDEVLDTLTELEDEDLDRIVAGFRGLVRRAQTGQLDINTTQVIIAALAASPDNGDLIGACAYTIAELTDHNPALDQLANDHRKEVIKAGQEAAYHLTRPKLRDPASLACAALDTRRDVRTVTDTQRKELSQKVADANRQSANRPK
ncbi:hypothetical protein [Streptomyces griseofuscus]|uniref:hypothetical protein n=1 Tax=Streptomyces griseofuscus TaxID=146922 RepID=UPI00367EC4F5